MKLLMSVHDYDIISYHTYYDINASRLISAYSGVTDIESNLATLILALFNATLMFSAT